MIGRLHDTSHRRLGTVGRSRHARLDQRRRKQEPRDAAAHHEQREGLSVARDPDRLGASAALCSAMSQVQVAVPADIPRLSMAWT